MIKIHLESQKQGKIIFHHAQLFQKLDQIPNMKLDWNWSQYDTISFAPDLLLSLPYNGSVCIPVRCETTKIHQIQQISEQMIRNEDVLKTTFNVEFENDNSKCCKS